MWDEWLQPICAGFGLRILAFLEPIIWHLAEIARWTQRQR
jgi:hypothetical protein